MWKIYNILPEYPVGGQGPSLWPCWLESEVKGEKSDILGIPIENVVGSQGVGRMETDAIANIVSQQSTPGQPPFHLAGAPDLRARALCRPDLVH